MKIGSGGCKRYFQEFNSFNSSQIFNRLQSESVSDNCIYLKEKIPHILPPSNQFALELKLQVILKLQNDENLLNETNCMDIKKYCNEILKILEILNAGECFIKGVLCFDIAKADIKISEINNATENRVRRQMESF